MAGVISDCRKVVFDGSVGSEMFIPDFFRRFRKLSAAKVSLVLRLREVALNTGKSLGKRTQRCDCDESDIEASINAD